MNRLITKKLLMYCVTAFLITSSIASESEAITILPAPGTFINGIPVAAQFDEFFSYPVQLLHDLDPITYADLNNSAGIGGLDVLILRRAGGIDNDPVGTGGFITLEDPVNSVSGGTSTFSDTWGAGLRPNDNGPVTVDQMLTYLHTQFGPQFHTPVFTFDLNEPGGPTQDLSLVANFIIWDPTANAGAGGEVTSWSADGINNGTFDPAAYILIEGQINVIGADLTAYSITTTGSGHNDFAFFAPGMNLSLFAGFGYEFHIFTDMINLDNGGEEAWISGAIAPPGNPIPEPATLALLSLGFGGLLARRKK